MGTTNVQARKIKYNRITFTLVDWGKVGKIKSTKYIHDVIGMKRLKSNIK